MTALQLNLHAELDDRVDHYVDQLQRDIAASGEQLVVDSRLAWHFFTDALKVHMIAEPTVAARRVLGRPVNDVEGYASVEEARSRLASRGESERTRFITRYGVDKAQLRNYDLICDSTTARPEEIVERIAGWVDTPKLLAPEPVCYLDPRRIRIAAVKPGAPVAGGPVRVGYHVPDFFAISGQDLIEAAARAGDRLIEAKLVAEADEQTLGAATSSYYSAKA